MRIVAALHITLYQCYKDATLLARLGSILSSTEITSCKRIWGSCDVMGGREWISCAIA